VRRDNEHRIAVKENNGGGWSSNGVVVWLGRRQNEDVIEWWREWLGWDDIFISVEGGSRAVRGVWSATVVRGEALPEDEAKAANSSWLHGKEAWHGASAWRRRPEVRRHRGGERKETTSIGLMWILMDQKIKKIHTVNSTDTNGRWRFKTMLS
jgi:hypothetical protein